MVKAEAGARKPRLLRCTQTPLGRNRNAGTAPIPLGGTRAASTPKIPLGDTRAAATTQTSLGGRRAAVAPPIPLGGIQQGSQCEPRHRPADRQYTSWRSTIKGCWRRRCCERVLSGGDRMWARRCGCALAYKYNCSQQQHHGSVNGDSGHGLCSLWSTISHNTPPNTHSHPPSSLFWSIPNPCPSHNPLFSCYT